MGRRSVALLVAVVALVLGESIAAAEEPGAYVVRPGDTLYSLAKRTGTTVAALRELNGIGPDCLIRVGQRLVLPGAANPVPAPAAKVEETVGVGRVYAVVKPVSEAPQAAADLLEKTMPSVEPRPPAAPTAIIPCTEEERLLLARLVMAEAGNEPLEGQVGVAAVVVNRVRHPGFPKSVTAVIQEPGQFKSVELERVQAMVPTADAVAAVDRALSGEDPTNGAIFFYNPAKSVAMDFWRTRPVTAVIGGHNFAR